MLKTLLLLILLNNESAVSIKARPMFGPAPLTVVVTVSLANPDKTSVICLNFEGAMYSRSCWPPTGKVRDVTIKGLSDGEYDVWVDAEIVQDDGSKKNVISNRLTVRAVGAEPQQ